MSTRAKDLGPEYVSFGSKDSRDEGKRYPLTFWFRFKDDMPSLEPVPPNERLEYIIVEVDEGNYWSCGKTSHWFEWDLSKAAVVSGLCAASTVIIEMSLSRLGRKPITAKL